MKKPSILFLAATHGDEGFAVSILKSVEKSFPAAWRWMLANERAYPMGQRFVDADLNRSAPGNPRAAQYEIRRAAEIMKIARDFDIVIDIHGTTANSGIFVILTKPTPVNIALASCLPIDNIVIWTAKETQKQGPLTRFVSCGLEIECGPRNSPAVASQFRKILRVLLKEGIIFRPTRTQRWFRVYGKLLKKSRSQKLQDFKETVMGGEKFYPLLFGQYHDVLCYKMEPIDFNTLCLF